MGSFEQICRGQHASLVEAALEFASDEYPELPTMEYLELLYLLGRDFSQFRGKETQPENVLRLLGDYFFGELGFAGNTEEYYDPRNSYLNEVIDRRVGIPITLSVLFQYLAHSVGITLHGMNFPGHFLLAYQREHDRIYIDVFQCGRWLDWSECEIRLSELGTGNNQLTEASLQPMSPRDILLRMLRNLKGIYSRADLARCLRIQQRIARLSPEDPAEARDLGILYFHAGRPTEAVRTLDRLKRHHPQVGDKEVIDSYLAKAARQAILVN
jgi:regulator of sirC expression with transglutaminase-like and TPR domain